MEGFTAAFVKSLGNLKAPAIGKDYSANYEQYTTAVGALASVFAVVGVLSHDNGYRVGLDNSAGDNYVLLDSQPEIWKEVVAHVLRFGARRVDSDGDCADLGIEHRLQSQFSVEACHTALACVEAGDVVEEKKPSKSVRNKRNRRARKREALAANAVFENGFAHGAGNSGVGGAVGSADVVRLDVRPEGVVVGCSSSVDDSRCDGDVCGNIVDVAVSKSARDVGMESPHRVRGVECGPFSGTAGSVNQTDSEGSVREMKLRAQRSFWEAKHNQNVIRLARQRIVMSSESESSGDSSSDRRNRDRLLSASKRAERLAVENKVLRSLIAEKPDALRAAESVLGHSFKKERRKARGQVHPGFV